ncbi:Aromatic amino acid aminotransferase [Schleiferilactobacillus perolens DSM 12744]|uniref:Aminotransferase n=2 Tax=Schleiferilactobacillus perolens TaxID=100468 RepID=A0A0R1N6N6_9LACO|nr:Aromatic amino acid aminotransferase [Schleiferilactobacillus perolens DSM 12744]
MELNEMALVDHMKKTLGQLKPSDILAFNHDISQIPGIIKLTLGEPDFNTPDHVKLAAIGAIQQNDSHYTASAGLPGLRQAASDFLANKYGTRYDPSTQLQMTAGVTEGVFATLTAMLNPGDSVIIPTPIFPLYIPITMLNGGEPVFINTAEDGFILTPEKLAAAIDAHADTVKAIILNFPTNPTGVTYSRSDLEKIADVVRGKDIFVISDEIYSELTYHGTHVSMGGILPEQTIVLNGVSKSHAMTGWRIGLIAGPADVVGEIGKVHQFMITSATTNAQVAAEEAFKNGQNDTEPMRQAYIERRDYLVPVLQKLGFQVANPDGAFYVFAKLPTQFGTSSWDFARALAHEAHVAVIPGATFGPGGEGYVRISYAASLADIKEAAARITKFVAAHPA